MKNLMYSLLPLMFILISFSASSQSETDWGYSNVDMEFPIDYDCDGQPNVLIGTFYNHSIKHFVESIADPVWNKMQGHGEFHNLATGENFKITAITKRKGVFPDEPTIMEQHINLIGDMGSHLLLTKQIIRVKNPDGSTTTEITGSVKCL